MKVKISTHDTIIPKNERINLGYYDSGNEFTTLYQAVNFSDLETWVSANLPLLNSIDLQELVIYFLLDGEMTYATDLTLTLEY